MAHIFSSDLINANNSTIVKSLAIASEETKSFSELISRFRNESQQTLIGPGYNSIRNKMSLYEDAFNKVSIICNNLRSNIIAANYSALNAMEGYEELNTDDLPENDVQVPSQPKDSNENPNIEPGHYEYEILPSLA